MNKFIKSIVTAVVIACSMPSQAVTDSEHAADFEKVAQDAAVEPASYRERLYLHFDNSDMTESQKISTVKALKRRVLQIMLKNIMVESRSLEKIEAFKKEGLRRKKEALGRLSSEDRATVAEMSDKELADFVNEELGVEI